MWSAYLFSPVRRIKKKKKNPATLKDGEIYVARRKSRQRYDACVWEMKKYERVVLEKVRPLLLCLVDSRKRSGHSGWCEFCATTSCAPTLLVYPPPDPTQIRSQLSRRRLKARSAKRELSPHVLVGLLAHLLVLLLVRIYLKLCALVPLVQSKSHRECSEKFRLIDWFHALTSSYYAGRAARS